MKSFTDIEQSRKLAEILPIESADMCYKIYVEEDGIPDYQVTLCPYKFASWIGVPCWSLAALLSVLDFPSLTQNKEDEWEMCIPDCESDGYIEVPADNPVDACVGMILKLHEQNVL